LLKRARLARMASGRSDYFDGRLLGGDDLTAEQQYARGGHDLESDVILDVVFDRGLLFLTVANLGDRPAHRVRIRFDVPFCGVGGTMKMRRLALFRKLEFLAPRKVIPVFLDRAAGYFARAEPTKLAVEVEWRTSDGTRRSRAIKHDLEIYRDLVAIDREVPHRGSRS
jgi:hypothetical protein